MAAHGTNPLVVNIAEMLPGVTRLGRENVTVKKENAILKDQIGQLRAENRKLRERLRAIDSENRIQSVRVKDLSCIRQQGSRAQPRPYRGPVESGNLDEQSSHEVPIARERLTAGPSDDNDDGLGIGDAELKPKKPKKKVSFLPPKSNIPSIMNRIERSNDARQIRVIAKSIICEPFASISAMKRYCVEVINTVYVAMLAMNRKGEEVRSYVEFAMVFTDVISSAIHERFIEGTSRDDNLSSIVRVIESMAIADEHEM
jgi:hypothetical protein